MFFGSKKNSVSRSANSSADGSASGRADTAGIQRPSKTVERQPDRSPDKAGDSQLRQRRVAASIRMSAAFRQIVTLLMRSPTHKHLSLSDLEWLVLPPLMTGQFRIAKVGSRKAGIAVPAAVILWASVSCEVDAKLSADAKAPIRLRPDEWRSGEIVWLVEAIGDPRVVSKLLKELSENTFKDRDVKVRTREGGNPAIGTLRSVVSKSMQN